MKLLVVALALLAPCAFGQELKESVSPAAGVKNSSQNTAQSSAPAAATTAQIQAEFVGTYRPDGKFKKAGKAPRMTQLKNLRADAQAGQRRFRPAEVPPWVDLHPLEMKVEDFEQPPSAETMPLKPPSRWANLRDDVITFVYGHERALLAPTRVTTDSRQRLIISDPQGPAIHVLDNKNPFRIVGGPGRRLQRPEGVAVDSQDNIYVADSKRRMILMYDPQGHFIRDLGTYRGENIFGKPTGIAIDRPARQLYVLDSESNELVVLDLHGNVLKRAGGRRGHAGVTFDGPSEIAVGNGAVIVLDTVGSRIQVLDSQCKLVHAFTVSQVRSTSVLPEMGLGLDSAANIYVSYPGASTFRVFKRTGEPVSFPAQGMASVGQPGAATGIWVDPADRMYVATSGNSRVQVFQLKRTASQ